MKLSRIMGLVTIAVFTHGCSEPKAIEEESRPVVKIQVAKIERQSLKKYVDVYGMVIPTPSTSNKQGGVALLTAPIAGQVKQVLFSEGQSVKRGELIVKLDDTVSLAQLNSARADLMLAEKTISKDRILFAKHNNSQQKLDLDQQALERAKSAVATAKNILSQFHLRAPISGIISKISVVPGESIDLNRVIVEIVNLDRLEVEVQLPAKYINDVRVGQKVILPKEKITSKSQSEPGRIIANVAFVSPSVNPVNGTRLLRLAFVDTNTFIAGQFLNLRIAVDEHSGVLTVPRKSVFTSTQGQSTISIIKNEISNKKQIETGFADKGYIEISGEGVSEGQTVATLGSYQLPDKTKVDYSPIASNKN